MARRAAACTSTEQKKRGVAQRMKPVKRQWRLLFWRRSKRGEHMSETRFTERAQAALRLARSVRPSWATAMWAASTCCWA